MTLSLRAAAIARQALDIIRSRCSSSGLPPHVGHEAELLARMIESLANTAVDEIDNVESQRRALVQSEKDADAEAAKRAAARHLHSLESQKSLIATRIRRELTTTIRHETVGAIAKPLTRMARWRGTYTVSCSMMPQQSQVFLMAQRVPVETPLRASVDLACHPGTGTLMVHRNLSFPRPRRPWRARRCSA